MKILIDLNHPAHVHLFRNTARIMMERGHQVFFTIRNAKITSDLMHAYGYDFMPASKPRNNLIGQAYELLEHDWGVLQAATRFKPDIMIGTSICIAHVSKIVPAMSFFFNEDDADYNHASRYLGYPFADRIVVPDVLRDHRTKQYVTYNSYHELAYLHPDHFTPDPTIRDELGVESDEPYFILRLVALKAHHDVGHHGISLSARRRLVEMLSRKGRVFITIEGEISEELRPYQISIPPHRIHHALNYASMLISDSQTMTIEAAVLGTPAVRCNTFVGMCSVIEELEQRYELALGYLPTEEEEMIQKVEHMLADPDLSKNWQHKRQKLLEEKIDLTAWMVDYLESYENR